MTNPVFEEPSGGSEKHDREAFEPGAGQRSRAIIPGDDPGDQQPPERGVKASVDGLHVYVPERTGDLLKVPLATPNRPPAMVPRVEGQDRLSREYRYSPNR